MRVNQSRPVNFFATCNNKNDYPPDVDGGFRMCARLRALSSRSQCNPFIPESESFRYPRPHTALGDERVVPAAQ